MKNLAVLVLGIAFFANAFAELDEVVLDIQDGEQIVLARVDSHDVKVDGHMDEAVWDTLKAYDEFLVIEPDTFGSTPYATHVRIFYDKSGIYFGFRMEQPVDSLVARLTGRDSRINRDTINITLDTSGEGRYGYWFGLALGDSLSDGTVLPERNFSRDWDGAWRGASQVTDYGWSGEMYIPWGTVSMPGGDGLRRLGMYISRKVAYTDERYGWPALPDTVPKFMSALQGLELSGINPRQQYSIYPFTAITDDRFDNRTRYRTGADFFWRPSTGFQLTATINPDFGAVESDDVVINLSATETFFPEKRLFFLEGHGIFVTSPRADTRGGGVGNRGSPTTLINTRRIGGKPLAPSLPDDYEFSSRELTQPVPLQGALKVTGQKGRFRYGAMAAFEDDFILDAELNGDPIHVDGSPSDYGVARLLWEDSPGGAYRAVGVISTAVLNNERDAMTHGLDAHYLSSNGKLKVDGQAYMSDIEGEETGFGGFLDFEYTFRKGVVQGLGIEYIDEHADLNDLGFLPRQDNFRIRSRHTRTSSNLSWARDNQFDIRGFVQRNRDGLFTGGGIFLANRMTFEGLSSLTMRASYFPKAFDDLNSFGNGAYRVEGRGFMGMGWDSDRSKPLSYGIGSGFQQEDLGSWTRIHRLSATWRPSDQFALQLNLRYMNREGWLLHQEDRNMTTFDAEQWMPSISADYFLTAKQQLRFSLQWVGIKAKEDEFYLVPERPGKLLEVAKPGTRPDSFSLSQMSMQLRYRWEIAPLSDLFIVYTRLVNSGTRLKSFSDTFSDGYDEPVGNLLVFKLRYRFGS